MVNTFVPFADFVQSARCLDYRRLGKQRVEAWQIYQALRGNTKRWVNHPATKMWRGHEPALLYYGICICKEWIRRGYKDTMLARFEAEFFGSNKPVIFPAWVFDKKSQLAFRSNLIRKDAEFYAKKFGRAPDNLPYTWGL